MMSPDGAYAWAALPCLQGGCLGYWLVWYLSSVLSDADEATLSFFSWLACPSFYCCGCNPFEYKRMRSVTKPLWGTDFLIYIQKLAIALTLQGLLSLSKHETCPEYLYAEAGDLWCIFLSASYLFAVCHQQILAFRLAACHETQKGCCHACGFDVGESRFCKFVRYTLYITAFPLYLFYIVRLMMEFEMPLGISFKAMFSFKVGFALDVSQLLFLLIMVFDLTAFLDRLVKNVKNFKRAEALKRKIAPQNDEE